MSARRSDSRRGSAIVEFTMVAIPLLLLICFTVEFGRAMWSFHTLAGAVKSGARYAIVHGDRCAKVSDACKASVGDVASQIRLGGFGLDQSRLEVTLTAGDVTRNCAPISSCSGDTSQWPPDGENAVGLPISVDAVYSFQSALYSFWPGQNRAEFDLTASSQEVIQF
jgi:Flp pilus assembly protein TadG